jgi:hypothetical protein
LISYRKLTESQNTFIDVFDTENACLENFLAPQNFERKQVHKSQTFWQLKKTQAEPINHLLLVWRGQQNEK